MRSAPFFLTAVLLAGCAGQRAPDGGPIDTEPPEVIATNPPNYTTRFAGVSLTLEFSEYVDHRSVETSFFVSPSIGTLEFEWSGREVTIHFSGSLRRSTTYVVTLGTDVADLRNRNRMEHAFTLAFSTGDDIDHGAIQGSVYPRKDSDSPSGIMVYVYSLNNVDRDTLDLKRVQPDYVTQTGKSGDFLLKHLAFGTYRLLAVRDEYKNFLYDPETDEFGIPPTDFVLTPEDTLPPGVQIQLTREDTSAVRLLKVTAPDQRHLLAEFSSPLDTSQEMSSWFRVIDTLNQKELPLFSTSPLYPELTTVRFVTADQQPERLYRLEVLALKGANGLSVNPLARSLQLSGSGVRDSAGPSIAAISVRDSATDIPMLPLVRIDFTDAIDRGIGRESVVLADSGGVSAALDIRWISDASIVARPRVKLAGGMWYSLRITMNLMMDIWGRKGRGAARVVRFRTKEDESISSIEGVVISSGVEERPGEIYVVARSVSTKDPAEFSVQISNAGPFELNEIPEGKFTLRAFRDENGNGIYDVGRVFPHEFSERFTQYADTLKVRARWPLEGVTLRLK